MKRTLLLAVLLLVGCSSPTEPIGEPPERPSGETWAAVLHYPSLRRPLVMTLTSDGSGAWRDSLETTEYEVAWRKIENSYLILLFAPESMVSLSMRRADGAMSGSFYEDRPVGVSGQAEAILR